VLTSCRHGKENRRPDFWVLRQKANPKNESRKSRPAEMPAARRISIRRKLRRTFVKKILAALSLVLGAAIACGPSAFGQTGTTSNTQGGTNTQSQSAQLDQDVQLLRQDIRSKKKQMVAANLQLTDTEATKFWPVYDQYTAELVKINDEKYAVIKAYADAWGNMTDAQALDLTNRALGVEQKVTQLRMKYVPIFNKVIPGTKVATFFQIERRLQAVIDLQLASQIPLVQAQQ